MSRYSLAKDAMLRGAYLNNPRFEAQSHKDWRGSYPLPAEVERYYRDLGPVDVVLCGLHFEILFPRLSALWESMEGFRHDQATQTKFPEWDDDWLVIARQGSDPFIYHRSTGRISQGLHRYNPWTLLPVCDDLETLILGLALLSVPTRMHYRKGDQYMDQRIRDDALPVFIKELGPAIGPGLLTALLRDPDLDEIPP